MEELNKGFVGHETELKTDLGQYLESTEQN